jgi:hypothetical protein
MTRDEATAEAARLNREHPERDRYRWGPREGEDGWSVVRVAVPKLATGPLTPSTQAKQPAPPPDEHPGDLPGGLPPHAAGA